MTNSRDVSAFFGKRHDNVLPALDELEVSEDFARLFLVQGFTGKKINLA